jgi:arabinose-5-phosphate isomerase
MSLNPDIAAALGVIRVEAEALQAMADAMSGASRETDLGVHFTRAVETIFSHCGRVIVTGVGKSGHVGKKIAATLASTGTPAFFIHAAEASHGDLGMVSPDDVVLALSKSGETRELADVIAYAKRFGITLIGISTKAASALGTASDIPLILPNAPEAFEGVDAPTTSTTLQMALGDCLAVALMHRRGFTAHDFKTFHPGGKLGAALKSVAELMHKGDELPLVASGAAMSEALLTMSEKRFGCVGVTDAGGRMCGIITDGDLRRHMADLMGKSAAEVMTRSPQVIAPEILAAEALKVMNEKRITVLFVATEGKPVGILHVHDLLRAGIL